jgi:signal peptidase
VTTGWRRKTVSILTWVALVAALVLAGLMVVPTLLGYERYVIVSGSMAPTIPVGAVIYDEVVPVGDIQTGDIITFVPPPEYDIHDPVTHRVVQITVAGDNSSHPGARLFQTKGDANEDVDAWQMVLDGPDQARYVHHIPYVGYVYMALQVRWVQALVIVIPAIALVVYILVTLWRASGDGVREEREKRARGDQARGEQTLADEAAVEDTPEEQAAQP